MLQTDAALMPFGGCARRGRAEQGDVRACRRLERQRAVVLQQDGALARRAWRAIALCSAVEASSTGVAAIGWSKSPPRMYALMTRVAAASIWRLRDLARGERGIQERGREEARTVQLLVEPVRRATPWLSAPRRSRT